MDRDGVLGEVGRVQREHVALTEAAGGQAGGGAAHQHPELPVGDRATAGRVDQGRALAQAGGMAQYQGAQPALGDIGRTEWAASDRLHCLHGHRMILLVGGPDKRTQPPAVLFPPATLTCVPRLALLIGLLAAGAALVGFALLGGGDDPPDLGAALVENDPFAWEPGRDEEFEARAAAGNSHVLYANSPGGVAASARRVERYRSQMERAAADAGVDADLLEAMVFLESAGRPEAMASDDIEGAVGLTQILAETATTLLGMRVDAEASERLTRALRRAERRNGPPRRSACRPVAGRSTSASIRQGPRRRRSLPAMALERFGRPDLAVVSYHMGMGNLEQVLEAYGERDVSYAQVFFDATPARHPRTYRILAGLGDDSKTYLWRVYAAREIMRLYREDRDELALRRRLQTAKASGEEVLHPREGTEVFEDPGDLEEAYDAGSCGPSPGRPAASSPTGGWASWPVAWRPTAPSTAGCGRRRTRWRPTWRPACDRWPAPGRR